MIPRRCLDAGTARMGEHDHVIVITLPRPSSRSTEDAVKRDPKLQAHQFQIIVATQTKNRSSTTRSEPAWLISHTTRNSGQVPCPPKRNHQRLSAILSNSISNSNILSRDGSILFQATQIQPPKSIVGRYTRARKTAGRGNYVSRFPLTLPSLYPSIPIFVSHNRHHFGRSLSEASFINQTSMMTLRTRFPSSSEVRLASSKARCASARPLNRCVTMSSRLGSAGPTVFFFCEQSMRIPVA